jgi:hypothetical protein
MNPLYVLKTVYNRLCKNDMPNKNSIDIMEHLPTLYKYAKECNSILETGVRGCISSWAFLYGLVDSENGEPKRMYLNDIDVCEVTDIITLGNIFNVDVKSKWCNNLELELDESYDITFIDTWHVYGQLKRELEKFSKKTNKYIIMHDTQIDEIYGESIRLGCNIEQQSIQSGFPVQEITKGLGPAVDEFLQNNKEWYLKEKYLNNNGLTILARR